MNEKIRDFFKQNIGYFIVALVSIVYIATAFKRTAYYLKQRQSAYKRVSNSFKHTQHNGRFFVGGDNLAVYQLRRDIGAVFND